MYICIYKQIIYIHIYINIYIYICVKKSINGYSRGALFKHETTPRVQLDENSTTTGNQKDTPKQQPTSQLASQFCTCSGAIAGAIVEATFFEF
jgi:hypothetical protein